MRADIPAAPCHGQHALFDSRRIEDHHEARKLCLAPCPLIAACRANLEAVKVAPSHLGGSPEGTWAGLFLGHRLTPHGAGQLKRARQREAS